MHRTKKGHKANVRYEVYEQDAMYRKRRTQECP